MEKLTRRALFKVGAGAVAVAALPAAAFAMAPREIPVIASGFKGKSVILEIENALKKAQQHYLFEFNDELTRRMVTDLMDSLLRPMHQKRMIDGYTIVCDDTNNPPPVVEKNEFHIEVHAEVGGTTIIVRSTTVPTGISFTRPGHELISISMDG